MANSQALESADSPQLAGVTQQLRAVRAEVGRVIVGQDALITRLLIALPCDGHCLVEGMPGLAKSLTVSSLAGAIEAGFVRIRFTPDLLPADLTGTEIFNAEQGASEVPKGASVHEHLAG
jgi:MoxR-like ATPase